jgi:hypothetical protein
MLAHTTHTIEPKHIQCCHCCNKCYPNLDIEPGKCAICPLFGRECNYGLEAETDPLVLSQVSNVSKGQPIRPHSHNNPSIIRKSTNEPSSTVQSRIQPQVIQTQGQILQPIQFYIPVVPLQVVHTPSIRGSQVYMPVLEMMRPRLASSTMVPSDPQIPYRSQVREVSDVRNPEAPSPEKPNKVKISLFSKKSSQDSPIKIISGSAQEI